MGVKDDYSLDIECPSCGAGVGQQCWYGVEPNRGPKYNDKSHVTRRWMTRERPQLTLIYLGSGMGPPWKKKR